MSLSLAPNLGATPAGLYYTAVYYMSDGSTNTQYWVVPAGAQATLGQVQAQVMPSTQAVQAVNKAYVDQAISGLSGSLLTGSGGTLSGPLTLCCDPTQPMQAADKHYVDEQSALAVPLTGGTMTGPLTSVKLGALYQADQFAGADFGAKLSACLSGLSQTNGGTCDARNFTGTLAMGSNLTNLDGECDGNAALRHYLDGEPNYCDSGNKECVAARVRIARDKRGEREPGRHGVSVFGDQSNGAGGRSELCDATRRVFTWTTWRSIQLQRTAQARKG